MNATYTRTSLGIYLQAIPKDSTQQASYFYKEEFELYRMGQKHLEHCKTNARSKALPTF